jgi:Uma2 family endonuclease
MGAVRAVRTISQAEYLQTERLAPTKSEYLAGRVIVMAGASYAHNRLSTNIAANLHLALRNKPCVVLGSDMRVKIAEVNAYFYPDVVIVCGQPQFEDEQEDTLLNPTVVIEVLSPSTEAFDRGEKFAAYQRIPTLREYLLVAQDRMQVEQYVRQPGGEWQRTEYTDLAQKVHLPSVGIDVPVELIYEGVNLTHSKQA